MEVEIEVMMIFTFCFCHQETDEPVLKDRKHTSKFGLFELCFFQGAGFLQQRSCKFSSPPYTSGQVYIYIFNLIIIYYYYYSPENPNFFQITAEGGEALFVMNFIMIFVMSFHNDFRNIFIMIFVQIFVIFLLGQQRSCRISTHLLYQGIGIYIYFQFNSYILLLLLPRKPVIFFLISEARGAGFQEVRASPFLPKKAIWGGNEGRVFRNSHHNYF